MQKNHSKLEMLKNSGYLTNFSLRTYLPLRGKDPDTQRFVITKADEESIPIEKAISMTYRMRPGDGGSIDVDVVAEMSMLQDVVINVAHDNGYMVVNANDAIMMLANYCFDVGANFLGFPISEKAIPAFYDSKMRLLVKKEIIGQYGIAICSALQLWANEECSLGDIVLEMNDRGYIRATVYDRLSPNRPNIALEELMNDGAWSLGSMMDWTCDDIGYPEPMIKNGAYTVPESAINILSVKKFEKLSKLEIFKLLAIAQGLKNNIWDRTLLQSFRKDGRAPFDQFIKLPRKYQKYTQDLGIKIFDAVVNALENQLFGDEISGIYFLPENEHERGAEWDGIIYIIPKFGCGQTPIGYAGTYPRDPHFFPAHGPTLGIFSLDPADYTFEFKRHLQDGLERKISVLETVVTDAMRRSLALSPYNMQYLVDILLSAQFEVEEMIQSGKLSVPLLNGSEVIREDGRRYLWSIIDNLIRYQQYPAWMEFSWEIKNEYGSATATGLYPINPGDKTDLKEE